MLHVRLGRKFTATLGPRKASPVPVLDSWIVGAQCVIIFVVVVVVEFIVLGRLQTPSNNNGALHNDGKNENLSVVRNSELKAPVKMYMLSLCFKNFTDGESLAYFGGQFHTARVESPSLIPHIVTVQHHCTIRCVTMCPVYGVRRPEVIRPVLLSN